MALVGERSLAVLGREHGQLASLATRRPSALQLRSLEALLLRS